MRKRAGDLASAIVHQMHIIRLDLDLTNITVLTRAMLR
jgi:hypothetical protein